MRFPLTLDVVGVRHYYSPDWPNHIDGYIKEEPENPYDAHAIAVCASDGKKIGHIARESTSLYLKF